MRWGARARIQVNLLILIASGENSFLAHDSRASNARWRDKGGCEEVASHQLPRSEGFLNREPDAGLDDRDGPNHCILSFDDLAFGSGWDVVMASCLRE